MRKTNSTQLLSNSQLVICWLNLLFKPLLWRKWHFRYSEGLRWSLPLRHQVWACIGIRGFLFTHSWWTQKTVNNCHNDRPTLHSRGDCYCQCSKAQQKKKDNFLGTKMVTILRFVLEVVFGIGQTWGSSAPYLSTAWPIFSALGLCYELLCLLLLQSSLAQALSLQWLHCASRQA